VGLYPPENEFDVEALRFAATEDNSCQSLLTLIARLLREVVV
jgi:hypothetical protein